MDALEIGEFILGLLLVSISGKAFFSLFTSGKWVKTKGRVVSSSMDLNSENGYTKKIEYEFEVDHVRIRSNRILPYSGSIDFYSSSEGAAQELPDNDSSVIVYFDPRDPSRCCLERKGYIRLIILLGIGLYIIYEVLNL